MRLGASGFLFFLSVDGDVCAESSKAKKFKRENFIIDEFTASKKKKSWTVAYDRW